MGSEGAEVDDIFAEHVTEKSGVRGRPSTWNLDTEAGLELGRKGWLNMILDLDSITTGL